MVHLFFCLFIYCNYCSAQINLLVLCKNTLIDMDTKEFIQGIITNELTGCFADCSQDNIDKLVDVLNRHHQRQAKDNEFLGDVSKRLLADTDVEYNHPTGLIKGKLMYDDDEFTTLILKYEGGIINLPDLDKCIVC